MLSEISQRSTLDDLTHMWNLYKENSTNRENRLRWLSEAGGREGVGKRNECDKDSNTLVIK